MAIRAPSGATLSPVTGPVPGGRLTCTGAFLAAAGITQTPGAPLIRPATQRSPELSQLGVEKSFPVSLLRRPASVADACGLAAAARSSVYTAGPAMPARLCPSGEMAILLSGTWPVPA